MPEFIKIEVKQIKDNKILLKINYNWAICLNANHDIQGYYLDYSKFNLFRLKKIFSDLDLLPCQNTELQKTSTPSFSLRPYQEEDVKFLSRQKSIGIFNEMRTGKTPTALTVFQNWKVSNLLIICPSILQTQWQEAVENWLYQPAYIISYLLLKERQIFYQKFCQENYLIFIVSKDVFKADAKHFRDLRKKKQKNSFCTIVDEAHFLRNYQSQQSKGIYTLQDSEYKMTLTGTPIVNHSSDVFGILKFLQPEIYTSYEKFVKEFFHTRRNPFNRWGKPLILGFRSGAQQKLYERLKKISVVRKQEEVLPWLPSIEYQKVKLLMEKNQQNTYFRWTQKWDKNYPLEFLAKLKTLTLYPPALIANDSLDQKKIKRDFLTETERKLLKNCPGSKIPYLVNFCQVNYFQSILIFSTRTETFLEPLAQFLQEKKIVLGLVTGKISHSQRKEAIDNFQQQKIKVLLCNIHSAGMGLNLSQADIAIFADRSYSPADNEQAEARFLPTNANENLKSRLIIDLICKGTIDEKISNLLKHKKNITKIIISNPEYLL